MSDVETNDELAIRVTSGKRTHILWCRDDGTDESGNRHFFAYNGSWPGVVTPEGKFRNDPAEIIWEGNAPFAVTDYDDAIKWILEQV